MPQMAPMNWLTLFIFTISIMIFISTMGYFKYLMKTKKKTYLNKIVNDWKW